MYKTEQEKFWSGKFGDDYVDRNIDGKLLRSNIALFANIFNNIRDGDINDVIEFGANAGLNIRAIKTLIPEVECSAVEINHKAAEILGELIGSDHVFEMSILDYKCEKSFDFVLIKGVLIHMNPKQLDFVYERIYHSAKKYICIVEYYNPTPTMVMYRGNKDKLFKRDFAGDFLDKYPDVDLVNYGFVYHRDNQFPLDDLTWFLLEKI